GGGGSPYSMKMRAIMRYRRLPFDWVLITPQLRETLKHDGPNVIPILRLPESGELRVDSTPLAYLLEERHAERSILPDDPCHRFLSDLIEDMGDEWLTKMMFHYRWFREEDQVYSSRQIISDNSPGVTGEALERAAEAIRARQVSRMALVGCTPENAHVIEAGYHEVLSILGTFVTRDEYLFGSRPSLGDFGLFGQLQVLASDHTPMLVMRSEAPRVYDWVRRTNDLSGVDGEWRAGIRPAVISLLEYASRTYLPFLAANLAAIEAGDDALTLEIDGAPFSQGVFKYQAKCYDRLKKLRESVTGEPAKRLQEILGDTGCLPYL
ncbi:MAG: glutathione S-transferase, partial [Pseudomonadales bacterium]|nr:glutathione S-transferase [Pseudomonadales bacterium]